MLCRFGPGLNHEPVTKKEMMDVVLGQSYRGKGVLKYVLTRADEQLRDGVGFRVKNVAAGNDWFVKDTYYVINVLVRTGEGRTGHAFTYEKIPSKANARPPTRCLRWVGWLCTMQEFVMFHSRYGCCWCSCYCRRCSLPPSLPPSPQNNSQHSREILKGKGRAGRGLLILILAVIHCSSDKVVGEDQLFKKLHDHIDKRVSCF